jgi:hypothetical protein
MKVIAFDSWTGGVMNIERLADAFARHGLDLMLIHIGSWGHDRGRPKEERIGKLIIRDISYYPRLSFAELLQYESPAAVLFLSTQAFAHRALNRYCREFGIPTLHLYHGLIGVQCTASTRLNPLNLRRQIILIASRVGKNLSRIWPVYLKALWETRAPLQDWRRFAYDVVLQATGRSYVGTAAQDATTDACCVYTEADVAHAVERYGVSREAVHVVGNPDLVKFGITKSELGTCLSTDALPSHEVMYIDTALIEVGSVFKGPRDFVEHLSRTQETLVKLGYGMVVKLHPAHVKTGVADLLERYRIQQCKDEEFVQRLKRCAAAIVEPSSAALIPALLGLPVLLAKYDKLAGQNYGKVLTSYPRARTLTALDQGRLLIRELQGERYFEAVWKWIHENVGPLPAEKMPERVAEALCSILAVRPAGRFSCW